MSFAIRNTHPLDSEEGYEWGPYETREEAEEAFNKRFHDSDYKGFSAAWYPAGGVMEASAIAIGADGQPYTLHEVE